MPKVDDVDTATNYANNGGSSWYITSNCKNVELAEDFLASTFGSSTDFYDAILPVSGAISCYLPVYPVLPEERLLQMYHLRY